MSHRIHTNHAQHILQSPSPTTLTAISKLDDGTLLKLFLRRKKTRLMLINLAMSYLR